MRTNRIFFVLTLNLLFLTATFAQTGNFDQTWKEFLENDKISNMSELIKPNKQYELPEYSQYLLMNTNTNLCQSNVDKAEELLKEIRTIDARVLTSIPGYIRKLEDLEAKSKAFYAMDVIWQNFLATKQVSLEELEAVEAVKTSCEKKTLAKYSFMTAYYHLCDGDVEQAKTIFQTRTLRLTEMTTLRVRDVEGLAEQVNDLKKLFQDMDRLDVAWNKYLRTGVSPGFDENIPFFECYPVPNIKVLILNGALDYCNEAPAALAQIKQIQSTTGVTLDREVSGKVKDLEANIGFNDDNLAALNEAWAAFIPDNKVKHMGRYGYEYCEKEPLVKAYIMDGFAYICELGESMLDKIDSLQNADRTPLSRVTMTKINELAAMSKEYQANGREIEGVWNRFIAQGDRLVNDYQSADFYCDNIHQVKDWTMRGLTSSCEEGHLYLQQIEDFQNTFEFNFTPELECRVQRLRIAVWQCRYDALLKLAEIEAPEAPQARLAELMQEYGVGDRPEDCQ